MDSILGLMHGLEVAAQPTNLLYCFVGALIGTLIGVLPGLGPLPTIAMLLPLTFSLPPIAAMIMLAGIYYGAQYGGSTTAILANLPGENSSIVSCLDGHQLARRGRAGPALAVAALASLFAGIIATFLIALLAPPLASAALLFGAADYFSLMVLGLISAIVLAQGSILKALGMIVLGLALSLVGTDVESGAYRMTLGLPNLTDGINFVPLAMGLFAVSEIIRNLENPEPRTIITEKISNLWPSREDFRAASPAALRGTLLGCLLGILPGGGAMLASFAAYTVEKHTSKHPERFGKGAVEGLAAPEAANNAGAQTSFIPLLTLGIPSNAVVALMAGALMIQGIQPGPQLMTQHPEMFWGVVSSMLIGNLMLVIINLPLIRIWVMLLKIPYRLFYIAILVFCCIGAYTIRYAAFDVGQLVLFGFVGYFLSRWRCEPAPLLLAFVLGPLLEENMRRALILSGGDATTFITRPISAILLLISAGLLALVALPIIRRTREEAFQEES